MRCRPKPPCGDRNIPWACPGLPGNDSQTHTPLAEAGGEGDTTQTELGEGGRERRDRGGGPRA